MTDIADRLEESPPRQAAQRPPPAPPQVAPGVVLAVVIIGGLGVIALWWNGTSSFSGLGAWVTNAGRIMGLLAGYGFVVLVALMARLPPLENGIGTDRLARWHATGGRYVVWVVVAHASLIIWGYSLTNHVGVVAQAETLVLDYPDVLMATVAAFLLIGIGIVSARAARRRLRYETWYHLHFYTYLAIVLAFSHQFAVGTDFTLNFRARLGWSGLYATVGALLLWYRVITPLRQTRRHRIRVIGVRRESPDTVSVFIGGNRLEDLRAQPGQFFRWRFLAPGLWWSANPYSLSAAPRPGAAMRITVRQLGDHSGAVARLRPGTRVIAEGPYGAFTAGRRRGTRRRALLLAGGVGITPLRALFETLPGDVELVYRASRERDVLFPRELDAIAQARGTQVRYLIGSRAELGYDPLSPKTLESIVPGLRKREVYLCGPVGMTDAAITALSQAGVPRGHIHLESFEF